MSPTATDLFTFDTPLIQARSYYGIVIPEEVSRKIGRRGPVPIIAKINGVAELRASIVAAGGGRHRLQLNSRVREEAGAAPGQRLHVELRVDAAPRAKATPADLERALRDQNLLAVFDQFPAGRRTHIVDWIESAVGERTREARIAKAVEVTLKKRMRVPMRRQR